MAEKYQQGCPLAPASVMPRSDEESAAYESRELRKKKRLKSLAYIGLFAVLQTVIILAFVLLMIRVKTPKVRLRNVTVNNSSNGNIRLTAQVTVKNTNFGRYEFDSSIGTLKSDGVSVGQFVIPDGRARLRSTKKLFVIVDVNPGNNTTDSGFLRLSSEAKLRGKVVFLRVLKRKKTADLSCTMSINLSSNAVQDLSCK